MPEISGLNAPYGARCFLTWLRVLTSDSSLVRLNAPYGARCFLTCNRWSSVLRCNGLNAPYGARCFLTSNPNSTCTRSLTPRLNAPYGARCFLTRNHGRHASSNASLNAPYGARCFLTARRVAPPVTRGNAMSDRQWPKKHPSDQQAQGQNIRLFIAITRIATDRLRGRCCPGNRLPYRRVARPQHPVLVE